MCDGSGLAQSGARLSDVCVARAAHFFQRRRPAKAKAMSCCQAHPELVMLEYAVNTDRNPPSFERLLRTLLQHPERPAVIVVNAHRWRAIRPHDGRTDKCFHPGWPVDFVNNRTQWEAQSWGDDDASAGGRDKLNADEDAIAKLCKHYNVPLVSMRGALLGAVRAGEITLPSFTRDCKHPSGQGHTFIAQLVLQRLLQSPQPAPAVSLYTGAPAAAITATTAVASVCGAAAPRSPLPAPFYGLDGMESAQSVCARGAQLRKFVHASHGFNFTDEGRGKGKLGASLEL